MIAGVVLGVIFIIIGVVYLTQTASNLPAFFPGHVAVTTAAHHTKYAILAFLIAIVGFALAWYGTGSKKQN